MKIRSGFVSNSSSSSFILDIPKGMTAEEFAGKVNLSSFYDCYGVYNTPEKFFKENFEKESDFKLDPILNHILGLEHVGFYSDVIPDNISVFFDCFDVPVEDQKNKSLADIVKDVIIKDHNLYELTVERGCDYRGAFGDLILYENDDC